MSFSHAITTTELPDVPFGLEMVSIGKVGLVQVDRPQGRNDGSALRNKEAIEVDVLSRCMRCSAEHCDWSPSKGLRYDCLDVWQVLLVIVQWQSLASYNPV